MLSEKEGAKHEKEWSGEHENEAHRDAAVLGRLLFYTLPNETDLVSTVGVRRTSVDLPRKRLAMNTNSKNNRWLTGALLGLAVTAWGNPRAAWAQG